MRLLIISCLFLGFSCTSNPINSLQETESSDTVETKSLHTSAEILKIASSKEQWVGIAISKSGRTFVSYPTWSDYVPTSVAELKGDSVIPFPDESWNSFAIGDTAHLDSVFIAVQGIYTDDTDRIWVLDAANPKFNGVHPRGPRMFQFNLKTGNLEKSYMFPKDIYDSTSYLNDVRVDTKQNIAYITDSGMGCIYVVFLESGKIMKRLENHPSTKADMDSIVIGEYVFNKNIHADGIALSPDRKWLYYKALSSHNLYRIPTEILIYDNSKSETYVEKVHEVFASDGMMFNDDYKLYIGALETNSIYTLDTLGNYLKIAQSDAIKWADTFAKDMENNMFFTTAQLHIPKPERETYKIFSLKEEN